MAVVAAVAAVGEHRDTEPVPRQVTKDWWAETQRLAAADPILRGIDGRGLVMVAADHTKTGPAARRYRRFQTLAWRALLTVTEPVAVNSK